MASLPNAPKQAAGYFPRKTAAKSFAFNPTYILRRLRANAEASYQVKRILRLSGLILIRSDSVSRHPRLDLNTALVSRHRGAGISLDFMPFTPHDRARPRRGMVADDRPELCSGRISRRRNRTSGYRPAVATEQATSRRAMRREVIGSGPGSGPLGRRPDRVPMNQPDAYGVRPGQKVMTQMPGASAARHHRPNQQRRQPVGNR